MSGVREDGRDGDDSDSHVSEETACFWGGGAGSPSSTKSPIAIVASQWLHAKTRLMINAL